MPAIQNAALDYLAATQHADGGWGYYPHQDAAVEATAAAVVSLRPHAAHMASRDRGVDWLLQSQLANGAWGLRQGDAEGGWHTAWALLALRHLRSAGNFVDSAVTWLAAMEVWRPESAEVQDDLREISGIDSSVYGWPWMPGEATWVEPTALAMLALADSSADEVVADRLALAIRFLIARRCRDGGWNVGNPIMLGADLPPRAHPTAWSILALTRLAPEAILAQDTDALRREARRDGGALALAWSVFALPAAEDVNEIRGLLTEKQLPDGSWDGNAYHTAIAVLALGEEPGNSL